MSQPRGTYDLPRRDRARAPFIGGTTHRQRPNGGVQQQSTYDATLSIIDTKLDRMDKTIHKIDKDVAVIKTDVHNIRENFATQVFVLKATGCTNEKVAGLDSSFRLARWVVGIAIVLGIGVATVIAIIVSAMLN